MVYNSNYCSIEDAWGNITVDKKKKKKSSNKDPICELYNMSANASYDDLDLVHASNSMEFEKYNKSRYQKDRQASREKKKYVQIDASDDKDFVPLYEQKVSDDIDLEHQFMSSLTNAQCSKSKIRMPDFESHFNPVVKSGTGMESDTEDAYSDNEEYEPSDYKEFKHILNKKQSPSPSPSPHNIDEFDTSHENVGKKKDLPDKAVNEDFYEDDYFASKRSRKGNMAYLDLILYVVSGIILIFVMEQFVKIGLLLQQ